MPPSVVRKDERKKTSSAILITTHALICSSLSGLKRRVQVRRWNLIPDLLERVWLGRAGPPSLPRTGDSAVKIPRKAVMSLVPHGLVTNLKPDLRFSQVMIESGAWPTWHPTHQIKLFVSRTLVILTRNPSSGKMCCFSSTSTWNLHIHASCGNRNIWRETSCSSNEKLKRIANAVEKPLQLTFFLAHPGPS